VAVLPRAASAEERLRSQLPGTSLYQQGQGPFLRLMHATMECDAPKLRHSKCSRLEEVLQRELSGGLADMSSAPTSEPASQPATSADIAPRSATPRAAHEEVRSASSKRRNKVKVHDGKKESRDDTGLLANGRSGDAKGRSGIEHIERLEQMLEERSRSQSGTTAPPSASGEIARLQSIVQEQQQSMQEQAKKIEYLSTHACAEEEKHARANEMQQTMQLQIDALVREKAEKDAATHDEPSAEPAPVFRFFSFEKDMEETAQEYHQAAFVYLLHPDVPLMYKMRFYMTSAAIIVGQVLAMVALLRSVDGLSTSGIGKRYRMGEDFEFRTCPRLRTRVVPSRCASDWPTRSLRA
jgi:hypothetical protein